jgi:4-hydroxybenzoyl-CoA reductase subunit beta
MTEALPDFALHRPESLESLAILRRAEPNARLIAGGTDLLPNLRRGLVDTPALIDLSALPGIDAIETRADGGLRLGAGLRLADLARAPELAGPRQAIAQAARGVAGPAHRNAATLGGNLCQDTRCLYYNQSDWWRAANGYCLKYRGDTCHVAPQGNRCRAAFASDLAPALIVLGAEVALAGAAGERRLPLEDLYRDDGADHLALAPDEVLLAVHLPPSRASRPTKRRASAEPSTSRLPVSAPRSPRWRAAGSCGSPSRAPTAGRSPSTGSTRLWTCRFRTIC